LSQGPDIKNEKLTSTVASDGSVTVEVVASEKRYLTYQGRGLSEHNISEVRYSINQVISDTNYQIANFKDGSGNSAEETVSFQLAANEFSDNRATVYVQAKDSSGRIGPIYAYQVSNSNSTTPQQPGSGTGDSSSSSGGGMFALLFGMLALVGFRRR
jgi:hypothetical protein